VTDIGAVKRYQEQMERSRQHLLAALDLMSEPVVVVDEEQVVRAATQSFYDAFKLRPPDVVGRPFFDIAKKRWNAPAVRSLLKQLHERDGAAATEFEHDLVGDGVTRQYRISGLEVPLEDARWTVMTVRDVTRAEGPQ
jgi:PAS domain-containing protein